MQTKPSATGQPSRGSDSMMVLRPCGDLALIAEFADGTQRRALDAVLRNRPLPGMVEQVPAARTVLVRFETSAALAAGAKALRELDLDPVDDTADDQTSLEPVTVVVNYDGADLAVVAELLDITTDEVVRRHTGQTWTVEFAGFMPGFGYLTGDDGNLQVPRRESPRTRVPAGAVALAGDYTSVYPRASPGGWQLIGSTTEVMFDADRQPPALLVPGARIRFEAIR